MAADKPDIVFFMADQLSAKWLEAASDGLCPTPSFDKLRARGVSFTNAFSSNPVCCASRATLATGLTSRGHGVLENGYQLDPALPTFMQVLQRAGWHTGAIGKVHFQPHFAGLNPDYKPYGYDVTHITEDSRGGEWLDWVQREHPEHFGNALATIWPTRIPEFESYGPGRVNLRERIERIRKNMKWATPQYPLNTRSAYALPLPEELSQTAWITGHATRFVRDADPDRPIFAHISYVQPHSPFTPPGACLGRVEADRLPPPLPAEWEGDPRAPRAFRNKSWMYKDWRYARQCYFADIAHLDEQLGKVMGALEEAGRLDEAYLIFLSDHGELLGDHGFDGKEERHYDACIRVPLVVCGPGLAAGAIREEFVQMEDLCPTVLEMASQRMPPMPKIGPYLADDARDIPVLPGRSLLGLCRDDASTAAKDWRSSAYCESYNAIWSIDPGDWARTLRTNPYRYTWYPAGGGEQLFDLSTDPDEQRNLAYDPRCAGIRCDLRDALLEAIVLQDYPKTRRDLFALGVH